MTIGVYPKNSLQTYIYKQALLKAHEDSGVRSQIQSTQTYTYFNILSN